MNCSDFLLREYSEALKRQMVAETQVPGASVSIVARRHDVNSNQLFRWRRQLLPKSGGRKRRHGAGRDSATAELFRRLWDSRTSRRDRPIRPV